MAGGEEAPRGDDGGPVKFLLWAGPLGILLALALLLASIPFFRSGPDVPTAGDSRAWNALWGAFGLVALGSTIGAVANLVWVARAVR